MLATAKRAKELFLEAIRNGLSDEGRDMWLKQACAGDAALERRVKQLLQAHHAHDGPLRQLGEPSRGHSWSHASPEGLLGDFRIIREAGRGGMGIVYEAEQISLRRRVALKVLPFTSLLDRRQLQRFQTEAMAAGRLHHPHIVPVYQVGSERAVHFYAMQYIEGRNISEWLEAVRGSTGLCRARGGAADERLNDPEATLITGLSTVSIPTGGFIRDAEATLTIGRATLPAPMPRETTVLHSLSTDYSSNKGKYHRTIAELGIQAAKALDYAHEHGILHRDVKPSNLMLDDDGHLWVTDFGLARIEGDSGVTMSGDLLGTLRYMSPEQVLGKRAIIDERTDVYSLGVTLYEMLTLRPAYDGTDRADVFRRISCEEPAPPRKFDSSIPPDLETIVLRAASKSPQDRYDTAKDLQDDLQRFLNHEPIKARRATLRQRITKWSMRHTMLLWTTAAVCLLMALTLAASMAWVFSAYQRERSAAAGERQAVTESRAVIQFLTDDLLAQADPDHESDRDVKVRTILDRAAKEIGGRFSDAPLARATILLTLGKTYRSLGEYPAANAQLTQAIDIFSKQQGQEHPDTLRARGELALLRSEEGKVEEAERLYREVLLAQQRILGDEHGDTLGTLHGLASNLLDCGKPGAAAELLLRVLRTREKTLGETHPETLKVRLDIARYRVALGALQLARSDLEWVLRMSPTEGAQANAAQSGLAAIAIHQGRVDEAEKQFRLLVESDRRTHGPAHPDTLRAQLGLAHCLLKGECPSDAESLCRAILATAHEALESDSRIVSEARILLAASLLAQQRLEEAEPLFLEGLECELRTRGRSNPDVVTACRGLRTIYVRQGRQEEDELLSNWAARPKQNADSGGSLYVRLFEGPSPREIDRFYPNSLFGSPRGWAGALQPGILPNSRELVEEPLYKIIKGLLDKQAQQADRFADNPSARDEP